MGNLLCRKGNGTFDNPINDFPQLNTDLDKAVDLAMGPGNMYHRLYLKFACQKLPNMDYLSKTDAFLVLFEKDSQSKGWTECGRTEICEDNLNPTFIQGVQILYYFERDQVFRIAAYDADQFDSKVLRVEDANYIGEAEFQIQKLTCSREKSLEINFYDSSKVVNSTRGKVTITYEEINSTFNQTLNLSMKALESGFIEGNNYFFVINKKTKTIPVRNVPVMRSEVIGYSSS